MNKSIHCCKEMNNNIYSQACIFYSEIFVEYGIQLLSDEHSIILLDYCPWCGKKLPSSKREEWFAQLEAMGYDDPLFDTHIPDKYKSSEWWREKRDSGVDLPKKTGDG